MPQFLPYIAVAATVAGTIGQYKQAEKAANLQQEQNDLATRRNAIQAIREVQMKRAATVNEAVSSGALGGSAVAGGITSLGSQLGSGLGYASQQTGLSADVAKANQKSDLFGAIAKIGGWGVQQYGLPGSTQGNQ